MGTDERKKLDAGSVVGDAGDDMDDRKEKKKDNVGKKEM
jgi:hypothetical protein